MAVKNQKAQSRTRHYREKAGHIRLSPQPGHRRINSRRDRGSSRSQAIQPVRKIDGVRRSDDDKKHQPMEPEPQIPGDIQPGNPQLRPPAQKAGNDPGKRHGDQDLSQQFFLGPQTQISFQNHLDIIVHKAQRPAGQGNKQHQPGRRRRGVDDRHRHADSGQNQQTAHRRRSRLGLVRRRSLLPDHLAELQPVQQGNGDRAQQDHHAERAQRAQK